MSKAQMAAEFVKAMCLMKFPEDAKGMSKLVVDWLTFANIKDSGSHKYVPKDRLNAELGLPEGAGVFGYVMFEDNSYILKTCRDGIAHWDGGESKPQLVEF